MLDRPIWQALSSFHSRWARRHGSALGYDPSIAPFVATEDDSPGSLADLGGLIRSTGRGALFTTAEIDFPGTLTCVRRARALQMVLPCPPGGASGRPEDGAIRDLTGDDGDAVRALVDLTRPGPFGPRTLELGRYVGVFRSGLLVAMAGERLHLPGHIEISAVCTHPDHRGLGLARALTTILAKGAHDRGLVPFLHVFEDNHGAVAAYLRMGFSAHRTMHLAVVEARDRSADVRPEGRA